MRISAIPAQITTVEDRIAGNLNLTQLILLSMPLFITAIIFFLMSPVGKYALYKLVISVILFIISSSLAIRINDKLVLEIVKLRLNFEFRPRVYVYRKRQFLQYKVEPMFEKVDHSLPKIYPIRITKLSNRARLGSQKLLSSNKFIVTFKAKSGGLIVKVNTTE